MPSGSILQTQVTTKTDSFSSSSSSTAYEDITGLSVAITPSSTSNKILIILSLGLSTSDAHADIKILRGTTDIFLPSTAGNRISSHGHIYSASAFNDHYDIESKTIQLLDDPSSTSSLTYKVQIATPYSASYVAHINRTSSDTDLSYNARTVSTITAMEIKG